MRRRLTAGGAVLLLTAALLVAVEPATAAPGRFTATPLRLAGRATGAKSPTSSLARTDPALLRRDDRRPVPVVVKLDHDPLATYDGRIDGLSATSPAVTGRPLSGARAERAYLSHLRQQEREFLARLDRTVPGVSVGRRLRTVYGGIALTVPANRLDDVLGIPGVVAVQSDSRRRPLTDSSADFLGTHPLYDRVGGRDTAGAGVVVGVLDTGVWPEHPSFADSGVLATPPAKADGTPRTCDFGDNPVTPAADPFVCNNKLIGGAAFLETYLSDPYLAENELYRTARDSGGHGTHTASTAAGGPVASAPVLGVDRGPLHGMAPGAWVSVYKVCGMEGCFSSDAAAAVAQAILDGVDVINYSVSGGTSPFTDPVELAFLDAYAAGVFVATSAGNSGPDAGTVNHLSPWVTTVGASTQRRGFESTLTLTAPDGTTHTVAGASITAGAGPTPVVLASAAPYEDEACLGPAPAGAFTGVIVACERGVNPRVDKGYNVFQGGAAGMILYNPELADVETDNHWLPAVHIADGAPVKRFLTDHPGSTARFTNGQPATGPGDVMAAFSSRGPGALFVKPDLVAPGVQILAGHSPTPDTLTGGPPGELYQAIAGTSMASPHVAGAAALLRQARPDWSPGQVRSALMTTARTRVLMENGTDRADPFTRGAGRIRPAVAADAGLTFDESAANMALFGADPLEAVHLNLPSVNAPVMPGRLATRRVATNVTGSAQTYRVSASAGPGASITVRPSTLAIPAGESAVLRITISSTAPAEQHFGQITLDPAEPGRPNLRLPVAFVPQQGDVHLASSCSPGRIVWLRRSVCTVTATNRSPLDATVDLRTDTTLPLPIVSARGATPLHYFSAVREDVPLVGLRPVTPTLAPGATPAGAYLPMSSFAEPIGIGDEDILNFEVPEFVYGGQRYTTLGVDANGYAIVGGGSAEDNQCCLIPDVPDASRPNNVLGPFWTDLDGTGAPGVYAVSLTDGERSWVVIEWDVVVWGTAERRHFQLWIGVNGEEDVSYGYDPAALPADPGNPFTVLAENADGTAGAALGRLPTEDLVVRTIPASPGESVSYRITVLGLLPTTGRVTTSMTTAVVPGTTVVHSRVRVRRR